MDKIPALIAKRPILHLAKLYHVGDELPTSDPVMLDAWLDAGSAEWQKDPAEVEEVPVDKQQEEDQEVPADKQQEEDQEEDQEVPADKQQENSETIVTDKKANPQTAEPGLPGESGSGEPDELVGKVPKTPERKTKKGAK
ncbi:hypothetical protein G4481_03445 [Fusicatenibacter saccharivorans]|uniref:hypothetical protein n=1 Tax=Fusicatenibacter saccharivorans TaxID=1150298 RepID=UPI00156D6A6F|nr:hypothetical protein [Fusicatenibacter saccharivorans]NSD63427.1 hypothetical protein [Fusicatenibacter saccharivorans]